MKEYILKLKDKIKVLQRDVDSVFFVNRLPFIIYIVLLLVVYIESGIRMDSMARQMQNTTKQLRNLKYEYLMMSVEWNNLTRPTQMIMLGKQKGLEELQSSPFFVDEENNIIQ